MTKATYRDFDTNEKVTYIRKYHECYAESTSRNGRKCWVFIGWSPLPDREPSKVTRKFRYYDTPFGRKKFRM